MHTCEFWGPSWGWGGGRTCSEELHCPAVSPAPSVLRHWGRQWQEVSLRRQQARQAPTSNENWELEAWRNLPGRSHEVPQGLKKPSDYGTGSWLFPGGQRGPGQGKTGWSAGPQLSEEVEGPDCSGKVEGAGVGGRTDLEPCPSTDDFSHQFSPLKSSHK